MESKLKYFPIGQSIEWVIKKTRSRKYDRIRDDKMKGHTKRNQNQASKVNEEDEIHEDKQIGSTDDRKISLGVGNLMDLDEDLLFIQIPSTKMVKENTIKKHCQNMWDEYFKNKSIFGKAQLFVKLFRRNDMRPILELLYVVIPYQGIQKN